MGSEGQININSKRSGEGDVKASGISIEKLPGNELAMEIRVRIDDLIATQNSAVSAVLDRKFPIRKDHISRVTPEHLDDFAAAWKLCEANFNKDERKNLEEQLKALRNPAYEMYVAKIGDKVIGFGGGWRIKINGEDWIFGEHIAIDPAYKKLGIGSLFKKLTKGNKLVFEFEHPDTADPNDPKNVRIAFFKKLGFCLNNQTEDDGITPKFNYIQPSYSKDKRPVPLILGTFPHPIQDEAQFEALQEQIYKTVYGLADGKLPQADLDKSPNIN